MFDRKQYMNEYMKKYLKKYNDKYINCNCSKKIKQANIYRHKKTFKHLLLTNQIVFLNS